MTTREDLVSNLPGQARMLDVLRRSLETAETLDMAVSFVRYSGAALIIDALRRFCDRGGRARILTSTYMGITQPEALDVLAGIPGTTCRVHLARGAEGFHTKLYIFQNGHPQCWVGSSNLSSGGLSTNLEANLRHTHPDAVAASLELFERLWSRDDVVPLELWSRDSYARAFTQHLAHTWHAPDTAPTPTSTPRPQDAPEHTWQASLHPNEAQREALARLAQLRAAGEQRAVVIAAPGVGKTLLAAFDARAVDARRVLFVSHRLEHLLQARDAFARVFGPTRTVGLLHGGVAEISSDILCATVASARNALARGELSASFDHVVIDEFHHAEASSYRALMDAITPGFLLGLTATPERADGHDVLRLCDYNVAYEVRLVEAIERGWLAPFHYFGIADAHVDYEQLPWRSRGFDPEALEHALMVHARVDHILRHAHERGYDGPRRATVGFCAGVRHARYMASELRARGMEAIAVTGEDTLDARRAIYARFEDPHDPLEWLFVSDLLNEGVDLPGINSLLFLRPTESATLFVQQLGRGLRLHPDCAVLTVLDFVGHHRNAWLTLQALHHPTAPPRPGTDHELGITPPQGCEIVLDVQTRAIMRKLRAHSTSKRDRCEAAYRALRDELGEPPMPIDLWGRHDMPTLSEVRAASTSWLHLRAELGDAQPWELELIDAPDHPLSALLMAAELDWQRQRVNDYALLWGLAADPSPARGYERFFERFPRWRVEHRPLEETIAWETLRKRIAQALDHDQLHPEILSHLPSRDILLAHLEGRLRFTLERDYQQRHNGVLSKPDALRLHHQYSRPDIIRHFGVQYDPAVHNQGVIPMDVQTHEGSQAHIILLTKIDTSGARQTYQYTNALRDPLTFAWQSQNRQEPTSGSGQRIAEHEALAITLHLFAQPDSRAPAFYLGPVRVREIEGAKPMNVTFALRHRVPPDVCVALGLAAP